MDGGKKSQTHWSLGNRTQFGGGVVNLGRNVSHVWSWDE